MSANPRTIGVLLLVGLFAAFWLNGRAETAALQGPEPDGARYRMKGDAGRGTLELTPAVRAATFTYDPGIAASDRAVIEKAIATSRPEARRLVELVDGLTAIAVGPSGEGTAGRMIPLGDRYQVILNLAGTWQAGGQRAVNRLVMHELGHVVDAALLTDEVTEPLIAATPQGWGCDGGNGGACAAPQERFAESFAKWATGDIGIDVQLGYAVPPPSPSLESWGRPLAAWTG